MIVKADLAAYFVDGYQTFAICGIPYQTITGVFVKTNRDAGYSESMVIRQVDKKVVLLMDEKIQSHAEFAVKAAHNGKMYSNGRRVCRCGWREIFTYAEQMVYDVYQPKHLYFEDGSIAEYWPCS